MKSDQSDLLSVTPLVLRFVQMSNSYCPRILIVLNEIQDREFTTFTKCCNARLEALRCFRCCYYSSLRDFFRFVCDQ